MSEQAGSKTSFWAELQRRHVYKVGAAYAVAAWLLAQVVTQVLPVFDVSILGQRVLVLILIAGFPVALVLAWLFDITATGIVRTEDLPADGEPPAAIRDRRSMDRRLNYVLGALLVLSLGIMAATFLFGTRGQPMKASASAIEKSIAVLPLTNESGDKDQQYFSDGLSEDLITALSQFAGLKVISRSSSFQFRDSKDDIKTIGEKLGVANLLEGSVQRVGDQVRISAALVNVADGSTLWSEHFDRNYADLFKLQDEITVAVARVLKTRLLGDAELASKQSDRPRSGNLAAYNTYLQGRYFFGRFNGEDMRTSIDLLRAAVRLDPDYAQAYVGLSRSLAIRATDIGGEQAQPLFAEARAAAEHALALDPNLASAHGALAWLLWAVDFNWSAADMEYRRALQLAPNDSQSLRRVGWMLGILGHPDEGVALIRQALDIDPLVSTTYDLYASFLPALGRLDEAEQAARRAMSLQPAAGLYAFRLVTIQVLRGETKAAQETAREMHAGKLQDLALALALQTGNDGTAADVALKKVIDTQSDISAYQIAEIQALRKRPDQAFEWLQRAHANRDAGIGALLTDPFLKAYRSDPRFAAFCKTVGLPAPVGP